MLPITTLILAAGRSRRFGRDKRLEPIDGVPMMLRTALRYRSVDANIVVVLRKDDSQHAAMLQHEGIATLFYEHAHLGMGSTLAFAVAQHEDAAGWLISPADLPFIEASTISSVLEAARSHLLAAARFEGQRGHPVWFDRRYLDELKSLTGDEGARSVLKANAQDLHFVDVADAGCVTDIDRLSDLASRVGLK